MSNDKYERIEDMPKSRRVATRIILGVWTALAVVAFVLIVALIA